MKIINIFIVKPQLNTLVVLKRKNKMYYGKVKNCIHLIGTNQFGVSTVLSLKNTPDPNLMHLRLRAHISVSGIKKGNGRKKTK